MLEPQDATEEFWHQANLSSKYLDKSSLAKPDALGDGTDRVADTRRSKAIKGERDSGVFG